MKRLYEADMKSLYRIIGYLDNTINLGLTSHVTDLSLHAYVDASWACHTDLKGHSGIIITIGHYGFPILCKCTKQKVVVVYQDNTSTVTMAYMGKGSAQSKQ